MDGARKSELAHPHDLLVRNVLADADLAADLLQTYLEPALASALEWDSLQREAADTVSPALSKRLGDLRYSARFKGRDAELKVFICLEHQSRPDRFMSLRMVEYVCAAYLRQASGLKKEERLPYPLAVVLHHGESPWRKIPPVRELISVPPGLEGDILGLPLRLIDVAAMSVDELRGHPMVCALLDSLQSASMGVLPARMQSIFTRLRGLGGEERLDLWVEALTRYYGAVRGEARNVKSELIQAYIGLYGKKEAEKMATTMLEQIQMEGEAKTQAKSVILFLESRFGAVPASIQRKLASLRDSRRLENMIKLAATCQSLREFQKAL